MFEFVGNVVQGGWDALSNVVSTVGKGASYLTSAFFPTPQSTPIKSNIVAPAGGAGTTYRVTAPQNQSMIDTNYWADQGWLNSPWQDNLSIPTKVQASQNLANNISSTPQSGGISGMLADIWGGIKTGTTNILGQTTGIKTVVDEFLTIFGLKKQAVVNSGPTEVGNSPGTTINIGTSGTSGADTTLSSAVQGFINQVKGLFNLGYDQTGTQATAPVTTSAGGMSMTSILMIGAVIVGIILFVRKK